MRKLAEELLAEELGKISVSKQAAGLQRRQVFFQGRVQGVGFRYTTRRIAQRFPVAGFVRNLPDGRVLVVAEAQADELDRFLEAVTAELGRYIAGSHSQSLPATGEFDDFEIQL